MRPAYGLVNSDSDADSAPVNFESMHEEIQARTLLIFSMGMGTLQL